MLRTPRERWLLLLALVSQSIPFAFGLIRAVTTGTDFRYLWMAVMSCFSAIAVMTMFEGGGSGPGARTVRLVLAAVMSTAVAAATGVMLGATSGVGIAIVSLAFGLCNGVGWTLTVRSRPRPGSP